MKTLALDQTTWDLFLDANGNWGIASEPYQVAQDASTAMRTFLGEKIFATGEGVPYLEELLGKAAPLQLVQSLMDAEALRAPGSKSASTEIFESVDGKVSGGTKIITTTGDNLTVST